METPAFLFACVTVNICIFVNEFSLTGSRARVNLRISRGGIAGGVSGRMIRPKFPQQTVSRIVQ